VAHLSPGGDSVHVIPTRIKPIMFISVKGEDSAYEGDTELAKRRKKSSYCASFAGVLIGLLAIVTAAVVLLIYYSAGRSTPSASQ